MCAPSFFIVGRIANFRCVGQHVQKTLLCVLETGHVFLRTRATAPMDSWETIAKFRSGVVMTH